MKMSACVNHCSFLRPRRGGKARASEEERGPHIRVSVERAALMVVIVNGVPIDMVGRARGRVAAKVGRGPALVVVDESGAGLVAMRIQRLAFWRLVAQHHRGGVKRLRVC
jgi:hypothetical protein